MLKCNFFMKNAAERADVCCFYGFLWGSAPNPRKGEFFSLDPLLAFGSFYRIFA